MACFAAIVSDLLKARKIIKIIYNLKVKIPWNMNIYVLEWVFSHFLMKKEHKWRKEQNFRTYVHMGKSFMAGTFFRAYTNLEIVLGLPTHGV